MLCLGDSFTLAVQVPDAQTFSGRLSAALTAELGETFSTWSDTAWVMSSYGLDALSERALYYVDRETLYEWSELAEEALDWEVCKLSPLCVTIADPPKLPGGDEIREAVRPNALPLGLEHSPHGRAAANDEGQHGDGASDDLRAIAPCKGAPPVPGARRPGEHWLIV